MKNLTKLICGLLFAFAVLVLPQQTNAEKLVESPHLTGLELKDASDIVILQLSDVAEIKMFFETGSYLDQMVPEVQPVSLLQETAGELNYYIMAISADHGHCYLNNQFPSSPAEFLTYSWSKYTQSHTLNLPRSGKFSRICPLPRNC